MLKEVIPATGVMLALYWLLSMSGFFPANLNRYMSMWHLPSGAIWAMTYGEFILVLGLLSLFFEILKSTRTTETSIIDHVFSTMVFAIYLSLWLTSSWAGNTYFFLLTLMSLFDVLAGFTITVTAAKRNLGIFGI